MNQEENIQEVMQNAQIQELLYRRMKYLEGYQVLEADFPIPGQMRLRHLWKTTSKYDGSGNPQELGEVKYDLN